MEAVINTRASKIRQIKTRRDVAAVADLIELCFADTMDSDGREYVRYLRKLSSGADIPFLASKKTLDGISLVPVKGFVWEEGGSIVGNLTLIYFYRFGRQYALIANVATHPDYRRKGIARDLTLKALSAIQSRGLSDAWLHVRDDNPAAENLYRSLGFEAQFQRTQWQWDPGFIKGSQVAFDGVKVGRRAGKDWPLQEKWFDQVYPPEVTWNLPIDKNRLKPNLWAAIKRYLWGVEDLQLSARYEGRLIGVLYWQSSSLFSDTLWLACDQEHEGQAARALLTTMVNQNYRARPLALNYPAGRSADVFHLCGFYPHLTLKWMRKTFSNERS